MNVSKVYIPEPCPFCGGKIKIHVGVYGLYFFKCLDCGAVVSFDNKKFNNNPEAALDAFNTRVGGPDKKGQNAD